MRADFFSTPPRVLSVGEFTLAIQAVLAAAFPATWVSGEVSGVKRHQNGHLYFTLKDAEATLPCVIWRKVAPSLERLPREGDHVEILGRLDLYPPHGRYQFAATAVRPKGRGELFAALERLKQKLAKEGFFAPERKRPLPLLPRCIGIVTSPTGAAIQDLIKVILARDPKAHILLSPALVQGRGAAASIRDALQKLARVPYVDVVICGRGGGALEDLWAFNEEPVARAIFSHPVPVVSAVGHETDITLADLVADVRASTPSHAGELVAPLRAALEEEVSDLHLRLARATKRLLGDAKSELALLRESLPDPKGALSQARLRLEEQKAALSNAARAALLHQTRRADALSRRLVQAHPRAKLAAAHATYLGLHKSLQGAFRARLLRERERLDARETLLWSYHSRLISASEVFRNRAWERLGRLADHLQALSPLATLARGYARVEIGASHEPLRDPSQVKPGDPLQLTLSRGSILCRVEKILKGRDEGAEQGEGEARERTHFATGEEREE